MLSDLILYLHNSNRKSCQVTLVGEVIEEEKLEVIGFVPADVVRLKESVWFEQLDQDRTKRVDEHMASV